MNTAIIVTSLVRSHVAFKFLNYVIDKIVRVVLTTLALMLRCVQTICVSVRERPREGERVGYVFSIHNKTYFLAKTWTRSVNFILLFTVFICLTSVVVGFGYLSVVRPLK